MDNPTGTVVGILHGAGGRRVTVDLDSVPVCPRCAEGRGCGAGFLAGTGQSRQLETSVDSGVPLVNGDRVELDLAPGRLLAAAVHAYGAPLLGAILAAAVAHGINLGDVASAAASLAGIALGTLASRLSLRRPSRLTRFEPRIDKLR